MKKYKFQLEIQVAEQRPNLKFICIVSNFAQAKAEAKLFCKMNGFTVELDSDTGELIDLDSVELVNQ